MNYCISYRAILVTILADSVMKEFVKFENKGFLQIYSAKKQAGANISLKIQNFPLVLLPTNNHWASKILPKNCVKQSSLMKLSLLLIYYTYMYYCYHFLGWGYY